MRFMSQRDIQAHQAVGIQVGVHLDIAGYGAACLLFNTREDKAVGFSRLLSEMLPQENRSWWQLGLNSYTCTGSDDSGDISGGSSR